MGDLTERQCPECLAPCGVVRIADSQLVILKHADPRQQLETCWASGAFIYEARRPQDVKPPLAPAQQADLIRRRRRAGHDR